MDKNEKRLTLKQRADNEAPYYKDAKEHILDHLELARTVLLEEVHWITNNKYIKIVDLIRDIKDNF